MLYPRGKASPKALNEYFPIKFNTPNINADNAVLSVDMDNGNYKDNAL